MTKMAFNWSNWRAPTLNPLSKQMGVSIGYIPTPQVIGSPNNAANLAATALPSSLTMPASPLAAPAAKPVVNPRFKPVRNSDGGRLDRKGSAGYTTSGTYGSPGSVSRSSQLGSQRSSLGKGVW